MKPMKPAKPVKPVTATEITEIFTNGHAVRAYRAEREARCEPNQLFGINGTTAALVVFASNGGDYPIGQRGLDRVIAAVASGKANDAIVVLAQRPERREGSPIYVAHARADEVVNMLAGKAPRRSNYDELGAYWFVSAAEFNSGGDDVPF